MWTVHHAQVCFGLVAWTALSGWAWLARRAQIVPSRALTNRQGTQALCWLGQVTLHGTLADKPDAPGGAGRPDCSELLQSIRYQTKAVAGGCR